MAPFRLLVIDDHPVVLSGLRLLFAADPRFDCCGEATSAADGCTLAEQLQPDAIVTDLVLGGNDGVALLEDLRAIVPAARILVYSSHDELAWARHALRAGAHGYVSKAEPLDLVAVALDTIVAGEIHVSAGVQRLLVKDYAGSRSEPYDIASLSARELQVLTLLGNGGSLQSVGRELGLSVKTIGTYRERLKTKLGLDSARMLERFAAEHRTGTAGK
jgi:DNA-binding NarL/FixJ family response regulator